MRLRSIGLCLAASLAIAACAASSAPSPSDAAELTFDADGRPVAMTWINDQGPFAFAIDTAAGASVISPELIAQLQLSPDPTHKAQLHGVSGMTIVDLYPIRSIDVGGVRAENLLLLAPPAHNATGGAHHSGLIGADVFAGKRVEFDIARQTVSITASNDGARADMTSLPADILGGVMTVVSLDVGGVETRAIIDTGARKSLGNLALMSALEIAPDAAPAAPLSSGITGHGLEIAAERATTIGFSQARTETVTVEFSGAHVFGQLGLADTPAIILGMDVLTHFDAFAIDHERQEFQFTE